MASLLYYLPDETRAIKLPRVRELGLGYAFEDRLTACGVTRGPDGQAGVVCADDRHIEAAQIGYYPDRQRWLKIPPALSSAGAWVGLLVDAPPRPEDLERSQRLTGHLVKLRDNHAWLIPVARALREAGGELVGGCALPSGTSIDESGNWTRGDLAQAEAALWEVACRWWDAVAAQIAAAQFPDEAAADTQQLTLDFAGENDAALSALAYNYRLGKAEVALLGLFDDLTTGEILHALIDWPTFLAFCKKKVAAAPPAT